MEQSSRRVDACQPLTTIAIAYVYCTGNFYRSTASFKLSIQTISIATACGPVLVISYSGRYPYCFALVLDALSALYCVNCGVPTSSYSLRTADYSSTVRFKSDTRGRSHRWSTVIRHSMEKSVGARARRQLREARGFGGLIWRIDVTARDCTETVLRNVEEKRETRSQPCSARAKSVPSRRRHRVGSSEP
jgi:hypothetical protein